jgi:hypothetical protein
VRAHFRDALLGAELALRAAREVDDPREAAECEAWLTASLERVRHAGELLARFADLDQSGHRGHCALGELVAEVVVSRLSEEERPALGLPPYPAVAAVAPAAAREILDRFLTGVLAVRPPDLRWRLLLSRHGAALRLTASAGGWTLPGDRLAMLTGQRRVRALPQGGIPLDAWELSLAGELSRRLEGDAGASRGSDRGWRLWIELPRAEPPSDRAARGSAGPAAGDA